jgi:hypothetical protein
MHYFLLLNEILQIDALPLYIIPYIVNYLTNLKLIVFFNNNKAIHDPMSSPV